MAKHGKKYTAVKKKVQVEKLYAVEEALQFIKDNPTAKFDETVEVALRMGVDPTKSDQAIRSTVALPNGSGKDVRVIVFATGSAAEAARAAGAVEAGFEDLLAKVTGGWMDFDIVISTPDAMKEVRKLGKVLGPRGLMPNPKTGTVTDDTATAVKQFKALNKASFVNIRIGNKMTRGNAAGSAAAFKYLNRLCSLLYYFIAFEKLDGQERYIFKLTYCIRRSAQRLTEPAVYFNLFELKPEYLQCSFGKV